MLHEGIDAYLTSNYNETVASEYLCRRDSPSTLARIPFLSLWTAWNRFQKTVQILNKRKIVQKRKNVQKEKEELFSQLL